MRQNDVGDIEILQRLDSISPGRHMTGIAHRKPSRHKHSIEFLWWIRSRRISNDKGISCDHLCICLSRVPALVQPFCPL